jgi:hypothetical protein
MRKLLIATALALALIPTPTPAFDLAYTVATGILYDRYCDPLPQDELDTFMQAVKVLPPEDLDRADRQAHADMAAVGPHMFCAAIRAGRVEAWRNYLN